jgi:hypothetical protein
MNIKSVYLPDSTIQNDEFPGHILWNKNDNIKLQLELPPNIEIKEIYNVLPEDITYISENTIELDKFEVNGYVGFVFTTSLMEEANYRENVKFTLVDIDSHKTKTYVKEIEIFRPLVKLIDCPKEINIEYDAESKTYNIDKKICFQNFGSGTALITVKLAEKENFELKKPDDIDEFISKFMEDLEESLDSLKENYPEYVSLVDDFYFFARNETELDDSTMEEIKELNSRMEETFENDEDFLEDFSFSIWNAYIKNMMLMTQVESFMNYLNSIGKNKIIIQNVIDVLSPKYNTSYLQIKVEITDLNYNEYSTINVPEIKVSSEKDVKVPIYMLFEWDENNCIGV